jgi:hypothetical protein
MTAAVKDMTATSAGTLSTNYTTTDPNAYPLTMVVYAIVPTSGISKKKAGAIAQFLDDVATTGQRSGSSPGELASGYLPLTKTLSAQTPKAADEVRHQVGDPKPKASSAPSKSPAPSPSPSASAAPSSSASASPAPSSIAVSFSRPAATGVSWVVLALLIAGAVLLVSGPAALVAGSPGGRGAIIAAGAAIVDAGRRLSRTRFRVRKRTP